MDTLHTALSKVIGEYPTDLLASLVERKLSDERISLTQRRKTAIRKRIQKTLDSGTELFFLFRFIEEGGERRIVLELTEPDIEETAKQMDEFERRIPELIMSATQELVPEIRKTLEKRWRAEERAQERDLRQFQRRLRSRWGEPMSKLHQLIVILTELGDSINNRLRKKKSRRPPYAMEVQTRLHARACQIAREVLTLLNSGFADGAMARWRTLHEITVMSLFIGRNNELAERYLLHNSVESLRAARDYQAHAERLGYDPLTPEEFNSLIATVDELKDRFGKSYGSQYGWAAAKLGNSNPTFKQIEARVDISHMRPYYKLASHPVHGNPKGILYQLGLSGKLNLLLVGSSAHGLADPGQNTGLSLLQCTSELVQFDQTLDNIVAMNIGLQLVHEIGELFVEVQQEVESERESEKEV